MHPDYEAAAIAATETLIKYGITSAPVSPLRMLKSIPGVLVVTYPPWHISEPIWMVMRSKTHKKAPPRNKGGRGW